METDRWRAVLRAILDDERSSASDRIRAVERLDKLEAREPDWEKLKMYEELEVLTDEELDRLLEQLGVPVTTQPNFLDDPAVQRRVQEEARRIASEETKVLRAEVRKLRTALAEASVLST